MAIDAFVAVLEADLRTLSNEARKSEGFAGHLAGWLSNSEHPEVKESAERAVLKLRAFARQSDCLGAIQASKEILRPFSLACETKNARLASLALGCIQKLLANNCVSPEGRTSVVAVLQHVEKGSDEGVKLKMLQTGLTLLQNPSAADCEDDICQVLGLCFRMLANPKNTETVISTAAATVRQAVAVVFDRALLRDSTGAIPDPDIEDVARQNTNSQATISGRTSAALHLLEDLCQLCSGSHATWVQSPVVQREFVLDLLQFIMSHNPDVFKSSPQFEEVLRERVCHILFQLLHGLLTMEGDPPRPSEARAVFKTVGTILTKFYMLMPAKESQLFSVLLQGTDPSGPLWRRMYCLQVLRQISLEPQHLYYLFVTFDMKLDYQLNAWHDLVVTAEAVIQRFLKLSALEDSDGPSMVALTALFKLRGSQGAWPGEDDVGSGGVGLAMLALDMLLRVVQAVETLTESLSPEEEPDTTSPRIAVDGSLLIQRHVCVLMVDDSWRMLLGAFQCVIQRGCGEFLVLQLLRGYQSILQACASLQVVPALNAFLTSLCELGLPLSVEIHKTQGASRAGGSISNVAPGTAILTPVNMQALRTLFNVVHELGNSLGSAWVLVVDTLKNLDEILRSPKTTTQEAVQVHEMSLSGQLSDLSILETAVAQLFESSNMLSTEAVVSLLSALRDASCQSIGVTVHGTKFTLKRMVDVLLRNLHRIHDLWGVFLTHIIEIVNNSSKDIRAEAISALDRAVTGAVGERPGSVDGESGKGSPIMETAVENMLLVALESLYRDVSDHDAQKGILTIALHVLQRHGELLSRGWVPILRILEAVPMTGDPELIVTGFESVELLVNDYLASVPSDLQRKCLEVTAGYGNQAVAVNVSLSTISLLWSASDHFGKLVAPLPGANLEDNTSRPGRAVMVSNGGKQVSDTSLLEALFGIMQTLSLDRRPEVRNSGVRTFFAVISSHGNRLPLDSWMRCLNDTMLPLLMSVYHISVTSSSEESEAAVLGRDQGGKSVRMIVHHSRNTERKQWDESLVLTFGGLGKVLKSFLPVLVKLEAFPDSWRKILEITENAIARGSKEVATAGIGLVTTVVQGHVVSGVMSLSMTASLYEALEEGITAMTMQGSHTSAAVRAEMVQAVGLIYASVKERVTARDLEMMLGWLDRLARCPFNPRDGTPQAAGTIPNVQRELMEVISEFVPVTEPDFWPIIFRVLCGFLYPHGLFISQLQRFPPPKQVTVPGALSPLWLERVVVEVVKIYRDHAPTRIRAMMFSQMVAAMTRCMVTRYLHVDQSLWRTAARGLNTVVNCGLPAVNMAYANGEDVADSPWDCLGACFEAFLLGMGVVEEDGAQEMFRQESCDISALSQELEESQTDAEVRTTVLDTLTDVVLISCEHTSAETKQRLIGIVDKGVGMPVDGTVASGGRFNHACLRKMYVLCSRGGGEAQDPHGCLLEVAQLALPMFIARCDFILTKFVKEDLRVKNDRLPPARIDEVLLTLEILGSLTVSPSVVDGVLQKRPRVYNLVQSMRQRVSIEPRHSRSKSDGAFIFKRDHGESIEIKERSHLMLLYEPLTACISTKEDKVRTMLQEILQMVGGDMGLCG
ncbi:hypothetical protein BSKO_01234 [Bryopsis sp. KO-2023]|nr:hypothetical protein BSKO_01234 [Bryopsis sp. KO-2023]